MPCPCNFYIIFYKTMICIFFTLQTALSSFYDGDENTDNDDGDSLVQMVSNNINLSFQSICHGRYR